MHGVSVSDPAASPTLAGVKRRAALPLPARWSRAVRDWWQTRHLLALLGSEAAEERETARAYFLALGAAGRPRLHSALYSSIESACGAAVLLHQLGDREGVRIVLCRCYEEEWILRCVRDGHPEGLHALRRLGREAIGAALQEALEAASYIREPHACLEQLMVALGALRTLVIFEGTSPLAWYARALHFGPMSLHGLRKGSSGAMARNLTQPLRSVALRGLLAEHRGASFGVLVAALKHADPAVVQTAILGLHRLGDKRALRPLGGIAFRPGHPLASLARTAIEALAGARSDALALLRAAQPEVETEDLLRPARQPRVYAEEPRTLLRPAV